MAEFARRNTLTIILVVVVAIMGGEILILIRQNRRLQSIVSQAPSFQVLQQGQAVPPLTATTLDGVAVSVAYGEHQPPTILIWLSPSCHLCAENAVFWNDLYARYGASSGVRFLVMSDSSPDETRSYVAEHALRFPVVCVTDETLIDAYNGRVMPQTALISPQGGIERVWPGALEKTRQDEVVAAVSSLVR